MEWSITKEAIENDREKTLHLPDVKTASRTKTPAAFMADDAELLIVFDLSYLPL